MLDATGGLYVFRRSYTTVAAVVTKLFAVL